MVVRQVARSVDDGYANVLVPGLRSSEDARRLADEIAYGATRLDVLGSDPPGLYAEAMLAGGEEGLWLAFLIALLSPQDGDEPFAAVAAARVGWDGGELPALAGVELGPRGADARRLEECVLAYRARVAKAGSQVDLLNGERALTPQRRFDRAFERLALPGFGRAPRFELLITAGRLGLLQVEPWTLALGDPLDPVTTAAKRIFGIGDRVLLGRRVGELAGACEVPVAALDLALFNWARVEDRYAAGVDVEPDVAVHDRCAAALAVA